ncbi:MAG: carbohydrate ABC transporter permease [Aigarchaeota archaeon]|nr:carbohydrate ABC transporter permease [Aigarchaeota archaeon]MCX8193406.1 carbohydrate ABC transporter permease [Nitrososphaeria archaeon]MDW7985936.1 carbohydrate ABC transporter permease [Nitrososphaerota archaeon]
MKIKIYNILLIVGIIAVVIFYFGPVFWTILISLKPEEEVYSLNLPSKIIVDRYYKVFTSGKFIPTFLNSVKVAFITTPLLVLLASPASYTIARFKDFKGRSGVFTLFLVMMLLPHVAIAGYIYTMLSELGLYDTIPGLIITYSGLFTPFAVWILTSYFRGIPKEIEEAALVDGASRLSIFSKVIIPLSLPGIAVTAILCFIIIWSEFLIAYTITLTYNARPVTIGTLLFVGLYELQWSEVATAALIATLPVLIIAFLTSKYIVKGLTAAVIRA